ncbi:hypothetical protein HUK80_15335 [Flavobacterium sp. MAH-1]|uniref:Uncharacterized protein n=1 Tax=Flavobacterium agri TaxID=2743471 RepID=A0A7Y9C6D9_9FLAO|nr:hypothetical protein [Flavobacterium agri]NUY82277.1 hypothetical protein [Flavobacterium agri]NYA72301.1 hypothetical protein [Flavobacterium agri]
MKKLLLFALLTTLLSCDVSYEPETRYVLKSHVTDIDGNPAANVRCELTAEDEDDSDLLSVGYTDANGNLKMVFPQVEEGYARYSITYARVSDVFQTRTYFNIMDEHFENDYTFSINATLDRIDETVIVQVLYEQSDANHELQGSYFTGMLGGEGVDYSDDLVDPVYSQKVYKNQTVQLHYFVFDGNTGQTTEHISDVVVGNDNLQIIQNY